MTGANKDNGQSAKPTAWTIISQGITVVLLGLVSIVGYFINDKLDKIEKIAVAVADIDTRLTRMEAGESPTVLSAALHKMQIENQAEHADIKASLLKLSGEIPKEIPPRWFQMQVDTLAGRVEQLSAQVVGRTKEGWHRLQMQLWAAEFQRLNPDSKMPSLNAIPPGTTEGRE